MDSNRKTAIIVGVLFIIATAAPMISIAFIGSIYDADYLTAVAANENSILVGVLLLSAMTAAIVSIPIMMFPILKKQDEQLALGYVGARIFEGFFSAVNVINILSLLSVSKEFVNAETAVASQLQTSGTLILAQFNWCSLLLDFPFTISALLINYLLYKSKLVPQWLSALGFVGGAFWLATTPLRMFNVLPPSLEILALIIMVQEMVFAVWLIVKGFKASATTS